MDGDGDFADPEEDWRAASAGGTLGGYFAPLDATAIFESRGTSRIVYPRVEVACPGANERSSVVVPYEVPGTDVLCGRDQDGALNCQDGQQAAFSLRHYLDWGIDRALWTLSKQFVHRSDDGRRGGIHACAFTPSSDSVLFGHGQVLNAFLRQGHGYGANRNLDPYYQYVTQCGLNALVGTYAMNTGSWFNDTEALGWDNWRVSYVNGRLGALSVEQLWRDRLGGADDFVRQSELHFAGWRAEYSGPNDSRCGSRFG